MASIPLMALSSTPMPPTRRDTISVPAEKGRQALASAERPWTFLLSQRAGHNPRMQIERNEIRCFHAVVEAGGFSRAAERLDLSQSAVSQAIANLEHRLGAVLLRRGNPPQLTEAGIRLLRFAETVMNEERETLADIAQIKSGALSTLSLALSPAANARFGIDLLKEFSERNPLTRLKVVVAPSREIVYGVSDGRWELGFGPLQHSMPEYFAFHPCFSETRRLMIARDHPSREALRRDPRGDVAHAAARDVVTSMKSRDVPAAIACATRSLRSGR